MGGLLYLVQQGGAWAGWGLAQPPPHWAVTFGTAKRGLGGGLLAVPNITAHPSTAIVYQLHNI